MTGRQDGVRFLEKPRHEMIGRVCLWRRVLGYIAASIHFNTKHSSSLPIFTTSKPRHASPHQHHQSIITNANVNR